MKKPSQKKRTLSPEHLAKIHANLAKARLANPNFNRDLAPISQLANPKPKSTSEIIPPDQNIEKPIVSQERLRQRLIVRRLDRYLDHITSVQDFNRLRKENPKWALEFAYDRVYGRPAAAQFPHSNARPISVGVLVRVLCGSQGAGPQSLGIDGQALTFNIPTDPSQASIEEKPD